jgi:O-antigen/teichoic acid export membrane protein
VVFVLLSSLGFGGLLTLGRDLVSRYLFSGVDYYQVILICLCSLVFSNQHAIHGDILKSQQKAMKSAILSISYFFLSLGLNITFVVVLKLGAVGVLLATLIANGLYFIYFMVDMIRLKMITFCLDLELLKDALKYSIPIMPHNLSTHIAMLVSKLLIGDAASLSAVGIYTVASQFGHVADTIQVYVDSAYGPWLYEKLKVREMGFQKSLRGTVKLLCAFIGLAFLGISLFAQDYIVLFVDKAYVEAWHFVPLIVLVFAIKTMYYFYVEVLFYHKKASKFLFTATLTGSLLNILLSWFLIPMWGVYGSIAADALAMVVRVAIIVLISRRFDDVGLQVRDFIGNFFVVAAFILAGLSLSWLYYGETFSWLNFGFKVLVVLVYLGYVALANRKQLIPFVQGVLAKLTKKGVRA